MTTPLTREAVERGDVTHEQIFATLDALAEARAAQQRAEAEAARVTEAATVSFEVAESERKELEAQHEEDAEFIDTLGQVVCGVAFTSGQYEDANEYARTHSECAFCRESGPRTSEAMLSHMKTCAAHPYAAVAADLARVTAERDELRDALKWERVAFEERRKRLDAAEAERDRAIGEANGLRVELLGLRDALRDGRACSGACECSGCVREYEKAIDNTASSVALAAEYEARIRADEREKLGEWSGSKEEALHAGRLEGVIGCVRHVKGENSFQPLLEAPLAAHDERVRAEARRAALEEAAEALRTTSGRPSDVVLALATPPAEVKP